MAAGCSTTVNEGSFAIRDRRELLDGAQLVGRERVRDPWPSPAVTTTTTPGTSPAATADRSTSSSFCRRAVSSCQDGAAAPSISHSRHAADMVTAFSRATATAIV